VRTTWTPVAAVVTVVAIRRLLRRRKGAPGLVREVRYRVPGGQDPAAVLAALRVEGFSARPGASAGEPEVIVPLDEGRGWDEVRDIVRNAPVNMQGDRRTARSVSFTDEV
jgi:hypothetical protein